MTPELRDEFLRHHISFCAPDAPRQCACPKAPPHPQAWTEQVDLELRRASGAKVLVILADVRLPRRKRRHDLAQMYCTMQGINFVIFIGVAKQVSAAAAADRALFSPAADFESGVKPEQGLPPVADWRFDTAGFPGNRSCVLLARLTYLAPASFRRGRIDCFAVLGENYAVNALCD